MGAVESSVFWLLILAAGIAGVAIYIRWWTSRSSSRYRW
jgi:hypothetical protein